MALPCGEGAAPLGCAAAPKRPARSFSQTEVRGLRAAAQPNGGQAPSPQKGEAFKLDDQQGRAFEKKSPLQGGATPVIQSS